jgi:hypothetical protein
LFSGDSNGAFVRATDKRAKEIPRDYNKKAKNADKDFGLPGQNSIQQALQLFPTVKGLVFGAYGESSESVNLLIKGLAYEGALKKADSFGQKNQLAAESVISWWLKRRWSRKSLITAVQVRYEAMRYVGGSAQSAAAAFHFQRQNRDDLANEAGRRVREREAETQYRRHW